MSESPQFGRSGVRRRPVHHGFHEEANLSVIIFLTVCAKDRKCVLASDEMHSAITSAWTMGSHWLVGRYVVMPDHIHLFCAPAVHPPESLGRWVRFWRARVTKQSRFAEGELWQRDFWDTQLRRSDSYALKWDYVRDNPIRAGLVKQAVDWPYQGELNHLRWHD